MAVAIGEKNKGNLSVTYHVCYLHFCVQNIAVQCHV